MSEEDAAPTVFLKCYVEVPLPYAEVRERMISDPRAWLGDLTDAAQRDGERLLVEVGLSAAGRRLQRSAAIETGTVRADERIAMLPVRFSIDEASRLFPVMEGMLDAAWLGDNRSQLALELRYRPPLGLIGEAVDRALLHRVAETVMRGFLESAAARLVDSRSAGASS